MPMLIGKVFVRLSYDSEYNQVLSKCISAKDTLDGNDTKSIFTLFDQLRLSGSSKKGAFACSKRKVKGDLINKKTKRAKKSIEKSHQPSSRDPKKKSATLRKNPIPVHPVSLSNEDFDALIFYEQTYCNGLEVESIRDSDLEAATMSGELITQSNTDASPDFDLLYSYGCDSSVDDDWSLSDFEFQLTSSNQGVRYNASSFFEEELVNLEEGEPALSNLLLP